MTIHQPGAHLDHMLRQTRIHHVQLSSMADIKANLLLTVASLVATLAASNLTRQELRWPVLILMGFCLLTIMLAIYAVMPRISNRAGEPGKDHNPMFNLLFFGD